MIKKFSSEIIDINNTIFSLDFIEYVFNANASIEHTSGCKISITEGERIRSMEINTAQINDLIGDLTELKKICETYDKECT